MFWIRDQSSWKMTRPFLEDLFILYHELLLYNLTTLHTDRVQDYLHAFLSGFCCGNIVAFGLDDVFEFFIFFGE